MGVNNGKRYFRIAPEVTRYYYYIYCVIKTSRGDNEKAGMTANQIKTFQERSLVKMKALVIYDSTSRIWNK